MRRGQPSDGYSRYDQEKFGKSSGQEELVLGFKINTTSTYDHMSLKSVMVSWYFVLFWKLLKVSL